MISIIEQPSIKSVGKTSLFIYFEYNSKIVDILRSCGNCTYHKNLKAWESPISNLAFLIDSFTYIDTISLEFLPESSSIELDLSQQFKTEMFDYQREGVKWLINNPNSLLLDRPGLGKSLQIIYTAEELKQQKEVEHCLIICGINALKSNWKREIQKHSNLDCVVIGERVNSKGRVVYAPVKERAEQLYNKIDEFFVIINIESIRDNTVIDAIRNSKNNFDIIVLDECHKAKSPTSDQGKNLLKLAKVGRYHYGLTGTVLVNSPLDAYVPLKFIGEEKSTYTNFKNYYCVFGSMFGHQQIIGFKNIGELKSQIASCSLRRTKDLLSLPPKVIVPEYIDLDDEQMKFYSNIQDGVLDEVNKVEIKKSSLLGLVTRLRQAATCPTVLTDKYMKNVKLERAMDLIEEIVSNGEKVIVFSTFKEPLYQLLSLLRANKYDGALLCTGDQPDSEIDSNIKLFQEEPGCNIILCTTSRMGTGLTLTAASYEIFIDSNWTFRLEEQCEDRAHRVGTTKSVIIYKLIAKNTIDERIQNILVKKRGISDYIIDDKYNEDDEIKELLGIG